MCSAIANGYFRHSVSMQNTIFKMVYQRFYRINFGSDNFDPLKYIMGKHKNLNRTKRVGDPMYSTPMHRNFRMCLPFTKAFYSSQTRYLSFGMIRIFGKICSHL